MAERLLVRNNRPLASWIRLTHRSASTICLQEAEVSITSFSISFWTSPGLVCPIIGQTNGLCVIHLGPSYGECRESLSRVLFQSTILSRWIVLSHWKYFRKKGQRSKSVESAGTAKVALVVRYLHYPGGLCYSTRSIFGKKVTG